MSRVIYARRLKPEDASAVARLERMAYPADQRNGRRQIKLDLAKAESEDANLSLGIYDGSRLIGFLLCYIFDDRASIFEDFEVLYERASQFDGKCVFIEDVVVLPRYNRHSYLLYSNWVRELRRKAPTLPVDSFCQPELLDRWTRLERGFRHVGLVFEQSAKVKDLSHEQEWHWLSWRQVPEYITKKGAQRELGMPLKSVDLPQGYSARLIQAERDWELLRDEWDRLVDSMPQASGFLSFDFVFAWWTHFGLSKRLWIIVLYEGTQISAIAPMMISPKRILGPYRWRLEFIGDAIIMESPDMIVDENDATRRELLWRCVLATDSEWDAAYLREQRPGIHTHPAMIAVDSSRYIASISEVTESPYVTFDQSWEDYLATRSRSQRKGFARKLRQLEAAGEWRFEKHDSDCMRSGCLEKYREVESRSWKAGSHFSVGGHPARNAFYQDVVNRLGPGGNMRFRFLLLDDMPIAATFGVFLKGHYASLEICHDRAFDGLSPGLVLTGLELEYCHKSTEYNEYNFLIGMYNNKISWKTAMHQLRNIYVLPKNLMGQAEKFLKFSIKPRIKNLLVRLDLADESYELLSSLKKIARRHQW